MAKQKLNEEFQRMQKLAGIQLNENEIDYDNENFSDPMIDGYDDTFLDSDFKSSSDYHEYNDVLEIIKSLKNENIIGFNAEDVLEDFESTFIGEKISKENYLEFINEYLIQDSLNKTYNSFSDEHVYITPTGKFAVLEFDLNDKEYFLELDTFQEYIEWANKEKTKLSPICRACTFKGHCLTEHYRYVKDLNNSCNGYKGLLEYYGTNNS
jgi:hypothetical protein